MKKIFLISLFTICSLFSSANITGPTYELEGSLGSVVLITTGSLSFKPNWNADILKSISVDFGPKVTLKQTLGFNPVISLADKSIYYVSAANLGFSSEFNFGKELVKGYVGLETGLGIGVMYGSGTKPVLLPDIICKLSGGIKLNNHKIGGFVGYGKGFLGIEYSYTFK